MNPGMLVLFSLLGLTACQSKPSQVTPPVELEVLKVVLPASVGASQTLKITVSVANGGCFHFTNFAAQQRTPGRLSLSVQGRPLAGSVGCPPVNGSVDEVYSDPGTPARTGPFEVMVNGKSYGSVSIQ